MQVTGSFTVGSLQSNTEAARLYVSLFNRAPTASELKACSDAISVQGVAQVAQTMLATAELSSQSPDQILDNFFTKAFGTEFASGRQESLLIDLV